MRDVVDAVRLPPQSLEAEQAILGALLLDNSAWDRIVDVVAEQDFYRIDHRLIFRHIAYEIDANRPADPISIAESLGKTGKLEDIGGRSYLGTLAIDVLSVANVRRHAQIVREAAQKRALIVLCQEALTAAYEGQDTAQLVEAMDAKLFAFQHRKATSRLLSAVLPGVIEEIDTLYSRPDKRGVIGLPTGFVDLDQKLLGLQAGDLIIIAGRPSMGKTALAMNMVEHVAVREKKAAAVFTLEMSDSQLTQRMIGSVGRLDQHQLRAGTFPEADWSRLTEAAGKLNDTRIILEETFSLSPAVMRARCRKLKREYPDLGVIVIDYLQLMEGHGERRVDQVAEISRALKGIAKELRIPVIALSQLSRAVENRPNRRPMMSDLRESGSLEQDADVILFLYRDEVYNPETEAKGLAELDVAKHRSGPTGKIHLTFLPAFTRFENYSGTVPVARTPTPRRSTGRVTAVDFKSRGAGE